MSEGQQSFLSLKCPACGKEKMFASLFKIKLKNECSNCGLKLSEFDVGDGPAYIGVFLICFIIPIMAVITEIYFEPSFIVHAMLWFPSIILLSYLILIYSKSFFIHKEFTTRRNK